MNTATLLFVVFVVVLTAAWLRRADKHGIVTAVRADVVYLFVLSLALAFAGVDDRDGTTAYAFVFFSNGHQLYVRAVLGHMLDHHVLALAAGHCDRVSRL